MKFTCTSTHNLHNSNHKSEAPTTQLHAPQVFGVGEVHACVRKDPVPGFLVNLYRISPNERPGAHKFNI